MLTPTLALLTLSSLLAAPDADADKTKWLKNYDEARMLAKQAGKPMFVVLRCER